VLLRRCGCGVTRGGAAGAVDWDLEKVQDEIYQREYKRQQAEQQQSQKKMSDAPVCGVSVQIIVILFAAFAGGRPVARAFAPSPASCAPGLAYVTSSNVVRWFSGTVLLVVINPLL
jgi:hypothetical protein